MTVITDEFMRDMLPRTQTYSVVFLKKTAKLAEPGAEAIIWEHGRRNFSLRADGILALVCPVTDDSEWAGIGIFATSPEEADRIMSEDPAVKAGVLTHEVHPVRSFPGDCLPGATLPRKPQPRNDQVAR